MSHSHLWLSHHARSCQRYRCTARRLECPCRADRRDEECRNPVRHERFGLHVSQFVLDEAGAGDPEAARLRLEVLRGLPELPATEAALALAGSLMTEGAVPEKARTDAAHIAVAAVHGMDFLVTWNCRHIANAEMEPRIRDVCARHGWRCPEICTPEQLLPKEGEGETP